jgi:hypothetical protein
MSDERVTLRMVILTLAIFFGSGLLFVPLFIALSYLSSVLPLLVIVAIPVLSLTGLSIVSPLNRLWPDWPVAHLFIRFGAFLLIVAECPIYLVLMLHTIANPHLATEDHFFSFIVFLSTVAMSIICFGALYSIYGIKEVATGANTDLLSDGLYFSIITWTTVGFGDFIPASKVSRRLAAYEAMLGYFTMASIFALAVVMLSGRQ